MKFKILSFIYNLNFKYKRKKTNFALRPKISSLTFPKYPSLGSEDIPISVPGPTRGKPFPIFREAINPSHWLIYFTWNMPISLRIFQWILEKKKVNKQLNKNAIYSKKRSLLFYKTEIYLWATSPWINILWSWKYLNVFSYLQMDEKRVESDHRMHFSNSWEIKTFHRGSYCLKQTSQWVWEPKLFSLCAGWSNQVSTVKTWPFQSTVLSKKEKKKGPTQFIPSYSCQPLLLHQLGILSCLKTGSH